eukprot:8521262-Ditylum_brightwellii.AAC.1
MQNVSSLFVLIAALAALSVNGFAPISTPTKLIRPTVGNVRQYAFYSALRMSESEPATAEETAPAEEEEEEVDEATRLQLEKQRRADELRAQEVFIQRSTGKHECTNCGWEYDIEKGDSMIIG